MTISTHLSKEDVDNLAPLTLVFLCLHHAAMVLGNMGDEVEEVRGGQRGEDRLIVGGNPGSTVVYSFRVFNYMGRAIR